MKLKQFNQQLVALFRYSLFKTLMIILVITGLSCHYEDGETPPGVGITVDGEGNIIMLTIGKVKIEEAGCWATGNCWCNFCHGNHSIKPEFKTKNDTTKTQCLDCHEKRLAQFQRTEKGGLKIIPSVTGKIHVQSPGDN